MGKNEGYSEVEGVVWVSPLHWGLHMLGDGIFTMRTCLAVRGSLGQVLCGPLSPHVLLPFLFTLMRVHY